MTVARNHVIAIAMAIATAITTLHERLKILAPVFQAIRSKATTTNGSFAQWRFFTTKTRMLCQKAFFFKFVLSLGNKEPITKID